ncbi:MAG TPA: T9SS type A sorting domain-containing protein [Ignavibacteria bacterium]
MKKILIILLLSISLLAKATTYYIDPNGNDITGNGTISSPWKSLYRACEVARFLGNVIHVNSGIYIETKTSLLAVGVSIEGEGVTSIITSTILTNEWTPIITLSSVSITDGNQSISYLKFDGGSLIAAQAIWIERRNNVKIHHCTFSDFNYCAVYWVGDGNYVSPPKQYVTGSEFYNNIVTNCAYMEADDSDSGRGALNFGGHEGMLIYNNNLSQTGRAPGTNGWPIKLAGNGGYMRGLKIYNNTIFIDDLTHWTFAIEAFNTYGLEMYGNTMTGSIDLVNVSKGTYEYGAYIHDNTIGPEMPSAGYFGVDFELSMSDIIIKYNRFRNCENSIIHAPRSGDIVTDYEISYNIFENISGTNAAGICFWPGDNGYTVSNFNIYNNIFYGDIDNPLTTYGIWFSGFETATNVNVINNIFKNIPSYWLYSDHAADIDNLNIKNNILYNNGNSNAIKFIGTPKNYTNFGNIIDDPVFYSSSNYHLQASSPAIDAGLPIDGITEDFEGIPLGNSPNIGCFETIAELANPAYVSSVIKNASPSILEITYDMTLDRIVPGTTAFEVKVNSVIRNISSVIIASGKVQLTLETPVFSDDIVTISYNIPASDPLQSVIGKKATIISDEFVINKVKTKNSQPLIKINIYPNPAQDFFNISIEDPILAPVIIRLIDFSGRIVFEDSFEPGIDNIQIPNNLVPGVYIVKLRSGSLTLDAQKLIINRP